jgi:Transposase, Mutator family
MSEAEPFWSTFLKGLVKRGLKGVKLVISDAHDGLRHAITRVLGATWQMCRVHWMRNALASTNGRLTNGHLKLHPDLHHLDGRDQFALLTAGERRIRTLGPPVAETILEETASARLRSGSSPAARAHKGAPPDGSGLRSSRSL